MSVRPTELIMADLRGCDPTARDITALLDEAAPKCRVSDAGRH